MSSGVIRNFYDVTLSCFTFLWERRYFLYCDDVILSVSTKCSITVLYDCVNNKLLYLCVIYRNGLDVRVK